MDEHSFLSGMPVFSIPLYRRLPIKLRGHNLYAVCTAQEHRKLEKACERLMHKLNSQLELMDAQTLCPTGRTDCSAAV